jgi:hypothetical protein
MRQVHTWTAVRPVQHLARVDGDVRQYGDDLPVQGCDLSRAPGAIAR